MLKIEEQPHGNLTILKLEGDIDLTGALALKDRIQDVRKSGAMNLILNCAGVTTVSSSVLTHLLTPIRALTLVCGSFALCNMSRSVQKTMQTAMFYPLILAFDNEDEAILKITENQKKGKK